MSWHPNSNKHKAQHGGYKQKPSKSQVKALLNLYVGVSTTVALKNAVKKQEGAQLKFDF